MSRLRISLFGPFQVTLNGEPITQFGADTARALLAYLALHARANAPCRRETLAGLLWPDHPEATALRNLRSALNRVREALQDKQADPPFLLVTRKTIQFNSKSDCWLDVATFADAIATIQRHEHAHVEACRSCKRQLEAAAELYRGDLLSGFSLPSEIFETWLSTERELYHRQALDVLQHLAAHYERSLRYDQAKHCAQRQLALEPWSEAAHQQLMRVLALSGQRSAALQQYEVCRSTLNQELGIEPAQKTTDLYEHIRDGDDAYTVSLRRATLLELTAQVTQQIVSSLDLDQLLSAVFESIKESLDCDRVSVFLSVDQERQGASSALDRDSAVGWAASQGDPLLVSDVRQDTRVPQRATSPTNTGSELALPIKMGRRILGVLHIESNQPGAFHVQDIPLLMTVADQLAMAIQNAILFEQVQRSDTETTESTA